jgi:hypothetical protein
LGAEELDIPRALDKVVFLRVSRSLGVEKAFAIFEVLRDVGREDLLVLLERFDLRFSPVGEMSSLTCGSGAELEVRWDTLGLPAVGSGIFKKLAALNSFSFIFLGACGVVTGVENVVAERFAGFGVAMSLRPSGDRDPGVRCLFTVPERCRDPRFELLSLELRVVDFVALLE